MKERAAERQTANVCHGEYGWPVARRWPNR